MSNSAVTVSPVLPSTPGNKRKITPTAQASESKQARRALLLATPSKKLTSTTLGARLKLQHFSPPKQLFPNGVGEITQQHTHEHPSVPQEPDSEPRWYTKHVLLPFQIKNIGDEETQTALKSIFPNTENVAISGGGSQLIFQVQELPKSPWPLTIGGMLFSIIDIKGHGRESILPRLVLGASQLSICEEYNVSELTGEHFRKLATDVHKYFNANHPGVYVQEVIYTNEQTFYVILNDSTNIKSLRCKLPTRIAKRFTGYLNSRDIPRPAWPDRPAKREIQPDFSKATVDDTAYNPMRPGVMILSARTGYAHPQRYSSTSGILVKNSTSGDEFMTAAAHAIGEQGTIYQPGNEQRILGHAQHVLSNTDICLLQLVPDVNYSNETFENAAGMIPQFSRLAQDQDNLNNFTACHLNSPYTGHMEAMIVAVSVQLVSSPLPTNNEKEMRWTLYNWAYGGEMEGNDQDMVEPPEGTCGSVIWDDDGVVQGFYQFYIKKSATGSSHAWAGLSASVHASELSNPKHEITGRSFAGYSLA